MSEVALHKYEGTHTPSSSSHTIMHIYTLRAATLTVARTAGVEGSAGGEGGARVPKNHIIKRGAYCGDGRAAYAGA